MTPDEEAQLTNLMRKAFEQRGATPDQSTVAVRQLWKRVDQLAASRNGSREEAFRELAPRILAALKGENPSNQPPSL